MNRPTGRNPGLLRVAAATAAVLAFSVLGPSGASSVAPTWTVHHAAVLTYADHDQDGGSHPDKSEPTRSGLHRAGLLDADPRNPGIVINGLTNTVNGLALSANRQILQSDMQNVGPGQSSDTEVTCPYPFKVVNGGESNTGNMVRLTKNYPATTAVSSAWHVQVRNDDDTPRSYRVYADCINDLNQYTRVEHLNQEVAPGASGKDYVKCPSDLTILGGGYSVDATDRFAVTASYAGSGLVNDWRPVWLNIGSSPARISVYAMCAAGIPPGDTKSANNYAHEYDVSSITCDAPKDQALAAGFHIGSTNPDDYIVVTDSYPTGNGYIVWAHQPNGLSTHAVGYCNTIS